MEIQEWERQGMEGDKKYKELKEKEKVKQREERWERIRKSRFSRWYGCVKEEQVPKYLKKGWGGNKWQRIAKFRLGNKIMKGRYWEKENRKMCRLCGRDVGAYLRGMHELERRG